MLEISRRALAKLFSGAVAAGGSAVAATGGFVRHRILRRPYRHVERVEAVPRKLLDALHVQCGQVNAPLRIKVTQPSNPESLLEVTVAPRSGECFQLLGVHGYREEEDTWVEIESRKPFKVKYITMSHMFPAFRREGGMIVYHDPFYKPHPETLLFGQASPHHRKLFGPGKDIGY